MPKRNQPAHDPAIEYAIAAWGEFEDPSAWHRSKRGNLWRHWDGKTLTVFRRDDDHFGWCIADDDDDTRFSPCSFESEDEAMSALGEAIGVGW